ncbi:ABC transporter substrate-binding protein [Mangrovibrevibacter kandeliae]|uniref:ABC transporter substrate-binding protein n=1 Tax=Mangrovibrevibacter kandeliae TaxID=2968473 RepID=UPI00389A1583
MTLKTVLTGMLVAGAASLAAMHSAAAAEKATLLLNWYVYGEHAPFYLGKEKGFFADEGVDLDIQEGRGSALTIQAVAAGTATFGYADVPTMIRAAVKGAPVKAVGVALQLSPMSVMAFTDKNIRKPEDIKGKTVAMTPGDSMSQIWPLFLKTTGLKDSDFNVVSGDAQTKLNAVANGRADMLLGYSMDQSMKLKDATGKDVTPIMFADYGINMVSSGVIVNDDTLSKDPDLVRHFMAAATKSVEYASAHPEEAAKAILDALPKAGKEPTLLEGFQRTIPLYHTKDTEGQPPFRVTPQNMQQTVDLLIQYGGLEAEAKDEVDTFYTNDYLPAAE